MKTKAFCCRRILVKNDIKIYSFVIAIFSLFYFFTHTMRVFVSVEKYEGKIMRENFFLSNVGLGYLGVVETIVLLIMPILLGIVLFKYIQSSSHVTMIHSMPFTRKELFNSHYIAGNILYMFPILLNQVIVLMILVFYESANKQNLLSIGYNLLANFLCFNLLFAMTVCIGMIVGNLVVQFVLSYIFLFLPKILSILLNGILAIQLKGFPNGMLDDNFSVYVSPYLLVVKIATLSQDMDALSVNEAKEFVIYHLIAAIGLISAFILAKVFYKYRQLERNKDHISYDFVRVIFVVGVSYCGMSLGGIYVHELIDRPFGLYFGSFVGSFVSYFVAQMIAEKTVFVMSKWKGFLIWIGVTLLILVVLEFDFIGYENRVMEREELVTVHFKESNLATFMWSENSEFQDEEFDPKEYFGYSTRDIYTSEEAVTLLNEIYVKALSKKNDTIDENKMPYQFYIELVGENQRFTRKYTVDYDEFASLFLQLKACEEYIYNTNPILWKKRPDYQGVYVENYQLGSLQKVDKKEIPSLIDAIHEDLLRIAKEDLEQQSNAKGEEDELSPDDVFSLRFEYIGKSYYSNRSQSLETKNTYVDITSRFEATLSYLEKIN